MSEHTLDTWVWCGHCSACAWGVPPHGEGNPCPLTVERWEWERQRGNTADEAYVAKLDAERAYWEHATKSGGVSVMDILKRNLS